MYRPDLATYAAYEWERWAGLVSIGWLDAAHEFTTGSLHTEAHERLRFLCGRRRVAITRGIFPCRFSPCVPAPIWPPRRVTIDGAESMIGSAEIRVGIEGGKAAFAAPNLVIHYVEVHGYLPPQEFVSSLMTMDVDAAVGR